VTPERLRRFFVKEETAYRVKKEIREMVVFAIQDVIKDPPFTRLDLLSCRNLMIYLEPELQDRLISTFHYALRPGGVLFLSPSRAPGTTRASSARSIASGSSSAWFRPCPCSAHAGGPPRRDRGRRARRDDGAAKKARKASLGSSRPGLSWRPSPRRRW